MKYESKENLYRYGCLTDLVRKVTPIDNTESAKNLLKHKKNSDNKKELSKKREESSNKPEKKFSDMLKEQLDKSTSS